MVSAGRPLRLRDALAATHGASFSVERTMPVTDTSIPRDGKLPAFLFYPGDFERDVAGIPLAAQGLWTRMLCWMHENEAHRGFLELPNGSPMTEAQIALRVGRSVREVRPHLQSLKNFGVFSIAPSGAIYCRRMARESETSKARSAAAKSRADRAIRAADGTFAAGNDRRFAGDFAGANAPANDPMPSDLSYSVSVSKDKADLDCPPANRKRRGSQADVGLASYPNIMEALARYMGKRPSGRTVVDILHAAGGASESEVVECLAYLWNERGLRPGRKNGPETWSWFQTVVMDYFAHNRERAEVANPCGYHEWADRNESKADREERDRMTAAIEIPNTQTQKRG